MLESTWISFGWKPRLVIGTTEQFRWLYGIIQAILLLNLCDAIFTVIWVETRLAVEANLLLRHIVHQRPVLFVLVKMTLVSLGVFLLWGRRHHALAVVCSFGIFLVYYWILLHHVRFASLFVPFLLN